MTQPDVALSDYLVTIEAALFAWILWKGKQPGTLRPWCVSLFASLSLASLAGGTTHGFFADESSTGQHILWPLTLIAIGFTSLCLCVIAARLVLDRVVSRRVTLLAEAGLVVYILAVLTLTSDFLIAIVAYLPTVLFLLTAFGLVWSRARARAAIFGAAACLLTLVASAIQQSSLSLPGVPHANNLIYHLLEAMALLLLFVAAFWMSSNTSLPIRRL